jgi:hypothetical protein
MQKNSDISPLYKHLCFPKTLQRSDAGTQDHVYWECSEMENDLGRLILISRHTTHEKQTKTNRVSNLHWVRVQACPFCGYVPEDQ